MRSVVAMIGFVALAGCVGDGGTEPPPPPPSIAGVWEAATGFQGDMRIVLAESSGRITGTGTGTSECCSSNFTVSGLREGATGIELEFRPVDPAFTWVIIYTAQHNPPDEMSGRFRGGGYSPNTIFTFRRRP